MSNPHLVKSRWTSDDQKTVIIDNNALAEARIQAYQEEQRLKMQRRTQEAQAQEEDYGDDFFEGLNADQLELLTADQDIIQETGDAYGETIPADGYDESEIPPDAGMFSDDAMGMARQDAPDVDMSEMVTRARAEADRIVAEASEAAAQIAEQARREGFEQGFAEGEAKAREEAVLEVQGELDERRAELEEEYQKALDEIEPVMVETLTKIYEHVFDVNLRSEKSIVLHLLQTTLSRVEAEGNFIVHLSPVDYDTVADEKERLRAAVIDPAAQLELVEDPLLHEGECMIESDGGIFDCSLGVELSELSRKLKLLSFDRRRN